MWEQLRVLLIVTKNFEAEDRAGEDGFISLKFKEGEGY